MYFVKIIRYRYLNLTFKRTFRNYLLKEAKYYTCKFCLYLEKFLFRQRIRCKSRVIRRKRLMYNRLDFDCTFARWNFSYNFNEIRTVVQAFDERTEIFVKHFDSVFEIKCSTGNIIFTKKISLNWNKFDNTKGTTTVKITRQINTSNL